MIFVQNHLWYLKENSAAGCKLLLTVHLPRKHGKRMDIGKYSVLKLHSIVCLPALWLVSTFCPCHEEFCETESLQAAIELKVLPGQLIQLENKGTFFDCTKLCLVRSSCSGSGCAVTRSRYRCVCSSARWTPDREWCNLWLGSNYSALQEEFREWLVQRACRVLLSCRVIMIVKEEWLSTSYLFTVR